MSYMYINYIGLLHVYKLPTMFRIHLDLDRQHNFFSIQHAHTVHPDTTNAERSSKRGYKQLYRGNTQGK